MADIKITVDESDALRALDNIEKKFAQSGAKVESTFDAAFDFSNAKSGVALLDALQKEFNELKRSADVLKSALNNATDPALIKSYAVEVAKLEKGMKDLQQAGSVAGVNLSKVNKEAGTGKQVFEQMFGAFTKVTLIVAAIEAIRQFAAQSIDLATQVSRATKQFEAFLGSADAAGKKVAELQSFASKKILPTQEVLDAGKGLLAFGEATDNVIPVLDRIADISRATGKNFGELTTIYGKARAAGVLYAEDINQLVDAGIPIIGEFAKQMGVTTGEVKKLASEGKISFEQLQLAFFNLTSEGGKFAGQAEAGIQAGDRFNASWTKALTQVGSVLKPAWDFVLNSLSSIIESVSALGSSKGLEDFTRKFFNFFSEINPAFALLKNNIESLFPAAKGKIEVDYTGRDAYEAAKEDLFERQRLEQEAEKSSVTRAKLTAKELESIEREKSKLRIDAMKDGEAKEVALENLRFQELVKQLRKYHIDTSDAEIQHQKNIVEIIYKFASERADAERELIDLRSAQGEFEASNAKKDREATLKKLESTKSLSELRISITEAEFDNLITTLKAGGAKEEAVKTAQNEFDKRIKAKRIEALIAYQKGLLKLEGNGVEAETIRARIQELEALLEGLSIPEPKGKGDGKPLSIYDLLGIKFDDPADQEAFDQAIGQIVNGLNTLAQARVDEAEAASEAAQKKADAAQEALDKEEELLNQGLANNFDARKKDLDNAKQIRDAALKEETKAKKAQIALDTVTQSVGLITSSVNIFKSLSGLGPIGIGLAVVTIGTMLAAFAATKAKALKAAEAPKLRKGDKIIGRTHEQGGELRELEHGEQVVGAGESVGQDRFFENMRKGKYKGLDLARIADNMGDYNSPVADSAARATALQLRREKASETMHYNAISRTYEKVGRDIVAAIEKKPIAAPWKNGYKLIKQTGHGTETETVQPRD